MRVVPALSNREYPAFQRFPPKQALGLRLLKWNRESSPHCSGSVNIARLWAEVQCEKNIAQDQQSEENPYPKRSYHETARDNYPWQNHRGQGP